MASGLSARRAGGGDSDIDDLGESPAPATSGRPSGKHSEMSTRGGATETDGLRDALKPIGDRSSGTTLCEEVLWLYALGRSLLVGLAYAETGVVMGELLREDVETPAMFKRGGTPEPEGV